MSTKFVELHLLQSFPPACVNRDGNNSPKDCMFGGYRRSRISSQCMKRAIRQSETFGVTVGDAVAIRSRAWRNNKLIPRLMEIGFQADEATTKADAFLVELLVKSAAKKDSKKKKEEMLKELEDTGKTSVGLYFGEAEMFGMLDAFLAGDKEWQKSVKAKSADVALFGRMLAEAPELNVDAAAQVAHTLSTHRLSQEMDYWTAADDLKGPDEDAGAAMLGTAEFNASLHYRYACVTMDVLRRNLGGDDGLVRSAVKGFLLGSHEAIPTGKLNGHAHFTPPYAALAVVREAGMPLNLCNAFLTPVQVGREGRLDQLSLHALIRHLASSRAFAPVDRATYLFASQVEVDGVEAVEQMAGYGALSDRVLELLG